MLNELLEKKTQNEDLDMIFIQFFIPHIPIHQFEPFSKDQSSARELRGIKEIAHKLCEVSEQ